MSKGSTLLVSFLSTTTDTFRPKKNVANLQQRGSKWNRIFHGKISISKLSYQNAYGMINEYQNNTTFQGKYPEIIKYHTKMRTAWWSQGITQNSYGEPLVFLLCYPSSLNHGSVENGYISNMIVSFHLGDQISTEPWLSCWWLNPTPLKNMLVMGSSSPNFRGENHKDMWVATT